LLISRWAALINVAGSFAGNKTYMQNIQTSKKIVLLFTLLITAIEVNAQWSKISSIYGGALANDGAVTFSIGSKGYVCAGSDSKTLYQYDTVSQVWTSKGAVPDAMGHAFSMAFVLEGKAYIVGGDTGGHPVATVWMYDPSAALNQWTRKADFPAGVRDAGVGFTLNNSGYVGCGFDGGNVYGDLWKYNAANDNWDLLPNQIQGIGIIFPSAFVINNKAYVIGGGLPPTTVVETRQLTEFDPVSKNWTVKAPFPGKARQAAFSFSNNSFGYVGGGQTGYTAVYQDMWRYNPDNDSWTKSEDAPLFSPAWSSAFVIGNNAYVGLGARFQGSGLTGVDSFYKYKMQTVHTSAIQPEQNIHCSVYPNPANNFVRIMGETDARARVYIYDNMGKLVLGNQHPDNIDISQLPDGVYTLQVQNNGVLTHAEFIKTH
jgi:N-acetylneuraminic acid mutarotase